MTVNTNREYTQDMVKMIPLYERKSKVFLEVFHSYGEEFKTLIQDVAILEADLFVDTAVNSLSIFERDLAITSVQGLQNSQRREQISSRYRASFDQTTEETIKSVAAAYSNGDVEVNETSTVGLYEIKFVGSVGIPNNINGLKKALDIIIPAHLGITYTYIFNSWSNWNGSTWAELSVKTWDELRNEVG